MRTGRLFCHSISLAIKSGRDRKFRSIGVAMRLTKKFPFLLLRKRFVVS